MRIGGIWLPARVTTVYVPGQQFARTMHITWFGMPVLRGLDVYRDGHGALTIGRAVTQGPEVDQGENLALWGEGIFTPTVWATDPHVRWEPIDETTVCLIVPFGDECDHLMVRADPRTGFIRTVTADRYRTPGRPKEPWKVELADYKRLHGVAIPTRVAVTWERDRQPWYDATIHGIAYNVPVASRLQAVDWRVPPAQR